MKPVDRMKSVSTYRLAGKGVLMLIIVFTIIACGGNRSSSEADVRDYEDLRAMVMNNREFAIEHQWANPMRGTSINLLGNPNYIRFKEDSVNIHLPYFGVRHSGGGYGSWEGGVRYEGLARNLEITENPEKRNILINFRGNGETNEIQEYRITVFPNGKASTSVNSSQRDPISYRGEIMKLPEEQE